MSWPITYQKDRPIVDTTVTADNTDTDLIVRRGLLTKSLDWNCEKEWRVLEQKGAGLRVLPEGLLSAVILGARLKPEDRERLLSWARQHPTPLEIREARLSREHFCLDIVNYKTPNKRRQRTADAAR